MLQFSRKWFKHILCIFEVRTHTDRPIDRPTKTKILNGIIEKLQQVTVQPWLMWNIFTIQLKPSQTPNTKHTGHTWKGWCSMQFCIWYGIHRSMQRAFNFIYRRLNEFMECFAYCWIYWICSIVISIVKCQSRFWCHSLEWSWWDRSFDWYAIR